MKRLFSIIVITSAILVFLMGNTPGINSPSPNMIGHDEDTVKSALVDMVADIIEKRGQNDSTIYLIGNVIFHHNGAIIQCDSAKKYSSNSMDFFGHVLINKDSAYIYGDKASYDGRTSIAEVFAPIVKMMRGSASLYTLNLKFNTETNIGYFTNGGLIIHNDTNHMESIEGEYNSDINEIIFRDRVAIHNPSYTAKSDSLKYNLDKDLITFLTNTTIWTKNNDILEASVGNIYTKRNYCQFNKDSYILSTSNEIWADTIRYETHTKRATLMSNIQIVDTVQKVIGFGDWGLWDDSLKNAILTRKPSIISYSSDTTDSLYLRADSLIMTTGKDSTNLKRSEETPSQAPPATIGNTEKKDSLQADSVSMDSLQTTLQQNALRADSVPLDSLQKGHANDSIEIEVATPQIKADTAISEIKKDSLINTEKVDSLKRDSMIKDSLINTEKRDTILRDSIQVDSLKRDSLHIDAMIKDVMQRDTTNLAFTKDTSEKDTIPRLIRGFKDVRGWSREYQFRCDSLVGHTIDSTGSLIGKPVLWNEENQLIAEQIDIYMLDGKIDWSDLTGEPILVQKVRPIHPVIEDSTRFNQASGSSMQAYFTNNELDSSIMQGNVHNIYWMDHKGYTAAIADITCADLTIYFKNRSLRRMKWNGNVDWKIYPLEKVDPKQEKFLPKFEWLDSIRPKAATEISNRTLRQSRREEVLGIPRPRFNTELMILSKMKRATEENIWVDRKEETTIRPDYFLTH